MRFEVVHETTYAYSRAVFIEPHTIRLRPRTDAAQRLLHFTLDIQPKPAGVTSVIDAWGNDVIHTWFSGEHRRLRIHTAFEVETARANPFDYIVLPPDADRIPAPLPAAEEAALGVYLSTPEPNDDIDGFVKDIVELSGGRLVEFCGALASRIHEAFEVTVRPEGDPWTPSQTWTSGTGSCRDLAVLYVDGCRRAGVPARFVSGYQEGDPPGGERELHAWGEVFVPGGGWRGYDPTHGLAVTDRHIAVAAAAGHEGAAPVTGTFRGTDASARMQARVELRSSGTPQPLRVVESFDE